MKNRTIKTVGTPLLLILGILAFTGCSRGPEMFTVQGKVTLDGEPISKGVIMFTGTDGGTQFSRATVADGSYELECEAGRKLVQIGGETSRAKATPPNFITTSSGLTAEVSEDTEVNFELSSKRSRRR